MARLTVGDSVKISTGEGVAYGKVAGLTQDVVYTDFQEDKQLFMTIHVTDVVSGELEVDTWQTCSVGSIVVHYDAPEDDPLSPENTNG